MTGTTDKTPAIHDKAANEIRFTCECGHVTHIVRPDPFELLSLYQHGMQATCETCRRVSELELEKVVEPEPCSNLPGLVERGRTMACSIQGNLGRCLYWREDAAELQEASHLLLELANALDAVLADDRRYPSCGEPSDREGVSIGEALCSPIAAKGRLISSIFGGNAQ